MKEKRYIFSIKTFFVFQTRITNDVLKLFYLCPCYVDAVFVKFQRCSVIQAENESDIEEPVGNSKNTCTVRSSHIRLNAK